jgi:hypothetical protein
MHLLDRPAAVVASMSLALLQCGGRDAATSRPDPPSPTVDAASPDAASIDSDSSIDTGSVDTGTPDAGPVATRDGPDAPSRVPWKHRPQAKPCSATSNPFAMVGQACKTDVECQAGPTYGFCVRGVCSLDQCLTDSDCANGGTCACTSDYYGGNAAHGNQCAPAACHVDSDCGPGSYCSPSVGYCGSLTGLYCWKPSDPCGDPQYDCQGETNDAGLHDNMCIYTPIVGEFVCGVSICQG